MFEGKCPPNFVVWRTRLIWLRTAGAIILRISHGYKIQEKEDPFVKLADEATEQFSLSTAPGGFLVNLVPQCWPTPLSPRSIANELRSKTRPPMVPWRRVPTYCQSLGIHSSTNGRWASPLRERADGGSPLPQISSAPVLIRAQASGSAEPSFTSNLLEPETKLTEEAEFDIKWSAASLYSGGSDTVRSTANGAHLFFLRVPYILRRLYPRSTRFSWPCPCSLTFRRKRKRKLTP
jgi:hypothetical protein